MVKTKKMNESSFEKSVKELNSLGEMIRTYQDEKQIVINDFDGEKKKFSNGKISKTTLASSAKKSNNELIKLDKRIRETIQKSARIGQQIKNFVANQSPKMIRVGVSSKKKTTHKKAVKRKAVKRKAVKRKVVKRKVVRRKSVKRKTVKRKVVKKK